MSINNLTKALGLGALIAGLSAGAAFAAVATTSANVRTGPGIGYQAIDRLHPGEVVAITDRSGSWCRIDHPGPNGWVSCGLLTGSRFDTYRSDRFRYDQYRYDPYRDYYPQPGVSFSFGFGTPYYPTHHRHMDNNFSMY